jgi:uncharacterized membrane protein YvbJ
MFCKNCGTQVDENVYRACPNCKAPLKENQYAQMPQVVIQNQNSNGGGRYGGKQGHSILLHLLFGWWLLYIPTLIFICNPKDHYWHL